MHFSGLVKRLAPRVRSLPNYTERLTTFGSKTKYRRVLIERCDPFNAETAHDGKDGAVDDRKVLVTPGSSKLPCGL
jgi:hypothetical protein